MAQTCAVHMDRNSNKEKKLTVFEYLVFLDEVRDADNKVTADAEMLIDSKRLLAKNQQQANTLVSREIPQDVLDDPEKFDRLVVVVRPF